MRELLARTEKNIKAIEVFNGNFALTVLNEWRYSTWHILSSCLDSDADKDDQIDKAERHLRRAYFDSCDLLLDCLLNEVGSWRDSLSGYEADVIAVFPQYTSVLEAARKANKASMAIDSYSSEERIEKYAILEASIVEMTVAVEQIRDADFVIRSAIRKSRTRTVWQFIIGLATIAGVLIAIFKS